MMITTNNIIDLIQEAISRNKVIHTSKLDDDYIIVIMEGHDKITIYYRHKDKSLLIGYNQYNNIEIKLSELGLAKFKLSVVEAYEYSKNKTVEGVVNFFIKDADPRPKDINDLDNDDD